MPGRRRCARRRARPRPRRTRPMRPRLRRRGLGRLSDGSATLAVSGRSSGSAANRVPQLVAADARACGSLTPSRILRIELADGGAQMVEIARASSASSGRAHRRCRQRRRALALRPGERQLGIPAAHGEGDAELDDGGDVHGHVRPQLGAAEHRRERGELVGGVCAATQGILRTAGAGKELGCHEVAAAAGGEPEPIPRGSQVALRRVHVTPRRGQLGGDDPGVGGGSGEAGRRRWLR